MFPSDLPLSLFVPPPFSLLLLFFQQEPVGVEKRYGRVIGLVRVCMKSISETADCSIAHFSQ